MAKTLLTRYNYQLCIESTLVHQRLENPCSRHERSFIIITSIKKGKEPTNIYSRSSQSYKINISKFNLKLKDEIQWRTFDHQLREIAVSHNTIDVLNPSYVHTLDAQTAFDVECLYQQHHTRNKGQELCTQRIKFITCSKGV